MSSYFDGDGVYRAMLGRSQWIFQVRRGRVYYDFIDVGAVESWPPATRTDWAAAKYEKVG